MMVRKRINENVNNLDLKVFQNNESREKSTTIKNSGGIGDEIDWGQTPLYNEFITNGETDFN